MVGAKLQSTDVDLYIVLQEVLSQLPHLFGPRSAPHESLSVRLQKEMVNFLLKFEKQHI